MYPILELLLVMLYSAPSLCPRNVQWPPSCSAHSWRRLALWTPKSLYSSCANAFFFVFCKLVHLAISIPPSLVAEGFKYFDNDVCYCFALSTCTGVDTITSAWEQAQLSLSRGSIGLHSLSDHLSACYKASLSMSGLCLESISNYHLVHSNRRI